MIKVLDKGYLRLVNNMGSDIDVANSARVSYNKEVNTLGDKDISLIDFLIKHKHDSTLRHCVMTFEVYAPLMVTRQAWKHHIASSSLDDQDGWNESCLPSWQELWSYGGIKVTVSDLLKNKNIPLRSINAAGVIVPNRVKNIWESSEQEVITITDEFGNRISCTSNHRILTPGGYVEAGMIEKGDLVSHNGLPAYTDKEWLLNMAKTHNAKQIADVCGVTDRTIHEYKKKFNISTKTNTGKLYTDKDWLNHHYNVLNMTLVEVSSLANTSTHTIRKWAKTFGIQKDHIKVLSDYIKENGTYIPELEDAYKRAGKAAKTRRLRGDKKTYFSGDGYRYRKIALKEQGWVKCFYCDAPIDEIHHKDKNRDNNTVENLVGLCSNHHYLIHGKKPMVYGSSKVVSIESAGRYMTYDIEMELEENFVAGGIIVHNSRRYITEEEEFYIPFVDQWRSAPENSKQGSGGPVSSDVGAKCLQRLRASVHRGIHDYKEALADGVSPEQARLLLPAYAMYVRYRWTASLNALLNFVSLRTSPTAQYEIQQYAFAVAEIVKQHYPITYKAWNEHRT